MPIKLQNLDRWELLPEGQALELAGNMFRKIKVEFNTEAPTAFMATESGAEYFLGVIDGHDYVEFYANGTVTIAPAAATDNAVWFYTADGDDHSHSIEGQKLFVKPMVREQRSAEMDAVIARHAERFERRFEMQRMHNERLFKQLAEERAAREAEVAAAKTTPQSVGSSDASAGGEQSSAGA